MPIVVPETGKVDLGQSRSAPVDTYAPPAVQRGDGGLGDLAEALSKLGVSFANAGAEQARKKEEQDLRNIEYFAGQVRNEIKDGTPYAVQIGQLLPEQSVTVRARVEESLGYDRGVEWARQQHEAILQDQQLRLNPELMDAKIKELRQQAAEAVKGNPSWGAGYLKAVEGVLGQASQNAQAERSTIYQQEQLKAYGREIAFGVEQAVKSTPVLWKTVGQGEPLSNLTAALAKGKSAEHVTNLKYEFGSRLDRMLAAMPPELRGQVTINSGFRSTQRQAEIFADAVKKYGSEAAARKWAAPPGKSNHNHGEAVDLGYASAEAKAWIHANADKFGLYFPMKHEPWHIEMRGGRREGAPNHRHDVPDSDGEDIRNPLDVFVAKVIRRESGGDPTAQNSRSSAGGLGQFVDGTWVEMVRTYGGEQYKNLSDDAIIRMKTDPRYAQLQTDMVKAYATENAQKLQDKGLAVTEENLDLMHFGGAGGGVKLIKASDTARVGDVLGAKAAAANPRLAKMTVAELKAEFAKKRGDEADVISAGRNAIRSVDRNWQVAGGLGNVVRRDAAVKYLQQVALDTADERYLDKLPPEWMNPEIEAQFVETRRKIAELKWNEVTRAATLSKMKEEEELKTYRWEIDQAFAQGLPVDPRKYANNSAAFNYALEKQRTEQFIDPNLSQTAADQLGRAIEAAAWKNDYTGVLGKAEGSLAELEREIDRRSDIRAADRIELKKKLPTLVNAGVMVGGGEAQDYFNRMLGDDLKLLQQSLFAKADPLNTVNYAGRAKQVYETELSTRIRAYVEENGKLPIGEAKRQIFEAAIQKAEAAVDKLKKESPLGQLAGGTPANPGAKPGSTPANPTAPAGGYTVIKRPDGKLEIVPAQTPAQLPKDKVADASGTIVPPVQEKPKAADAQTSLKEAAIASQKPQVVQMPSPKADPVMDAIKAPPKSAAALNEGAGDPFVVTTPPVSDEDVQKALKKALPKMKYTDSELRDTIMPLVEGFKRWADPNYAKSAAQRDMLEHFMKNDPKWVELNKKANDKKNADPYAKLTLEQYEEEFIRKLIDQFNASGM